MTQKIFEEKERLLYFNVNFDCNNNCVFCAAGSKETRSVRKRMSASQISRILTDFNVNAKDTIIINGGEPTVHPELISILEDASSRGAFVYLFSNGTKFSDISFASSVVETGVSRIAIPLYSHVERIHDFLTRHEGSFLATIGGIQNLFYLKRQNKYPIEIELKTLLCTKNASHLPQIVNTVVETFPQPDYLMFSSICVSDAVTSSNIDIVPKLSRYAPIIRQGIDIAIDVGLFVCLYYIPLCILKYQKYAEFCDKDRYRSDKNPDVYFDSSVPHGIFHVVEHAKGEKCHGCDFHSHCDGVWASYAKEFGFDELCPINIDAKKSTGETDPKKRF